MLSKDFILLFNSPCYSIVCTDCWLAWYTLAISPFLVHNLKYNLHFRDNASLFVCFSFLFFLFRCVFSSFIFWSCNIIHQKLNNTKYTSRKTVYQILFVPKKEFASKVLCKHLLHISCCLFCDCSSFEHEAKTLGNSAVVWINVERKPQRVIQLWLTKIC